MSAPATMMMNAPHPHRKPVPASRSFNSMQPPMQPAPQSQPSQYTDNYSRSRNSSSSPSGGSPVYGAQIPPPQQQPMQYNQTAPRNLSMASTSTATNSTGLQRAPTNSSMPRRSTSSRSTTSASPTSYVALMRKQKATVWCDRAQFEDPATAARLRQAKMHAQKQVAGSKYQNSRVSTSSSYQGGSVGIRSKIRHQGAPKASTYTGGANMSGAGVPIRLSATEVDDDKEEDERDSKYVGYHQQGASSRSSIENGHKLGGVSASGPVTSNTSTPTSGLSPEDPTPVPNSSGAMQSDYFPRASEDSVEAERQFGGIAGLPQARPKTEQELMKMEEDLKRRGSVDDRSMSMSRQRLFVANPDLSD